MDDLLSMESWAATEKSLSSVAVPPAPVRIPSQRPLAPSVASVTSVANNKDDEISYLKIYVKSKPFICRFNHTIKFSRKKVTF